MLENVRLKSFALLALYAVVCGSAVNLAWAAIAWAYVDPSVMTYTIQALAGVAVALSAVAGVAFSGFQAWPPNCLPAARHR